MRELIKKGAYSVTAPRKIQITDGREFNEEDVRLIYNETKDEVLVSSGEKVGVIVVGEEITIPNDKPAIDTNDILTIEIDFPQKLQQLPEFSFDVVYSNGSASFNIPQSGILMSLGSVTDVYIRPKGSNTLIPTTLPHYVNVGDRVSANATPGSTQKCVIQYSSLTGATINSGQLGSKLVNGCNNFAYFSPTLNKVVISGLATFDEDNIIITGDGLMTTVPYGSSKRNRSYIEKDGYLYHYSAERLSLIKTNLVTKEVTLLYGYDFSWRLYIFIRLCCRYKNIDNRRCLGIDFAIRYVCW